MIKVLVGQNEITGVLKNYEKEGDDLVLRLALRGPHCIEVRLPKFPPDLVNFITRLGLDKLRDCTIDLNKGVIKPTDKYKSSGDTVEKGKLHKGRRSTSVGTGTVIG